ncbi:MAG: hypothetical protein ACP5LN_09915 [Thermoproteota archaeon]
MSIKNLIEFLNHVDLKELNESLDELDKKAEKIFQEKNSDVGKTIVIETERMSSEEFVWFCFLKANFLRGSDITSNKAFMQFINYCKNEKNNYYFNKFPSDNFLPKFKNPKFLRAAAIEKVLEQLRGKYKSGSDFIEEIKELANNIKVNEIHELYLELIAKFMGYKYVGSKIANAIIGEVIFETTLLSKYNKSETVKRLIGDEWIRKLLLASFFNVMIDTHVRNFFEEKLGIKGSEHSILIFIGKSMNKEITKSLFERNFKYFKWIEEKEEEVLLNNYHEYIGACMLEKMIWLAYFVKKNSRKSENVSDLKFFKLSGDLFL